MFQLARLVKIFSTALKTLTFTLVLLLVIVVFTNVVLRFVFHSGFSWNEEASRFLFVWTIYSGIAISVLDNSHISLTLLSDKFPKIQPVVKTASWVVSIIFFCILMYFGVNHSLSAATMVSSSLNIPLVYVYMIIPISAFISIVFLVSQLILKSISEQTGEEK